MAGMPVHFELPSDDANRPKDFWQAGEKTSIPHVGLAARCADTGGDDFSLSQSDESAA